MPEYISKEVAIEKTEEFCDVFVTKWTDEKVLAWIRNLPAADVMAVVRCKDCKFQGDEDDCPLLSLSAYTEPDDFCSYGERRGEDE